MKSRKWESIYPKKYNKFKTSFIIKVHKTRNNEFHEWCKSSLKCYKLDKLVGCYKNPSVSFSIDIKLPEENVFSSGNYLSKSRGLNNLFLYYDDIYGPEHYPYTYYILSLKNKDHDDYLFFLLKWKGFN